MSWVQPAAMNAYIKCIENYSKKLQDCLNDCENCLQAQCGGWLNSGILFIIALSFIFVEYRNCKLKCRQTYD